jgi:glycosyltransferase involved in cell wall biosynthesis
MKQSRLFILDPLCSDPSTHHIDCMMAYRSLLQKKYGHVVCIASERMAPALAKRYGFSPELPYLYDWVFGPGATRRLSQDRWNPKNYRGLRRATLSLINRLLKTDRDLVQRASGSWRRLFQSHGITAEDSLFLMGADYYGTSTLLKWLFLMEHPPAVHCHFNGAMENNAYRRADGKKQLFQMISRYHQSGRCITLSADVPALVEQFNRICHRPTLYFPCPFDAPPESLPTGTPAVLACIGGARKEKGYFLMADLAHKLQSAWGTSVALEFQAMDPTSPEADPAYEQSLASLSNVRLLPPFLEESAMETLWTRSLAVLLPYDASRYHNRSSVAFQRALALGRPVIAFQGIGSAILVERYGNGYLCGNLEDMVQAVGKLLERSSGEWETKLDNARALYNRDVHQAMDRLFQL